MLNSDASAAQVPKPPKVTTMARIPVTIQVPVLEGAARSAGFAADGRVVAAVSTIDSERA
jgi:hypothetical protein